MGSYTEKKPWINIMYKTNTKNEAKRIRSITYGVTYVQVEILVLVL